MSAKKITDSEDTVGSGVTDGDTRPDGDEGDVQQIPDAVEAAAANPVDTSAPWGDASEQSIAAAETPADDSDNSAAPDDAVLIEDDAAEAEAEPEAAMAHDAGAQVEERVIERVIEKRGGFVPAVVGGIVAALLGFAAGSSDLLAPYLPASLQRGAPVADGSAEDIAGLRSEIAALEAQIGEPPEAPDLSGIQAELQAGLAAQTDALSATQSSLSDRLDALELRIDEIAQAPVEAAISDEAVAAYERELAAVQETLAQQRAEVEEMLSEAAAMEAEASESARVAQAQAALTRLFAALETGEAFAGEVTELQSLGVTVPDALVQSSDGLVSLATLTAQYPELARSALADAREASGASGGLTGFLQRQLGARSVTPREGDDVDAILSRAEAALLSGDTQAALSELDALPDPARAPLAGWIDSAAARVAALSAADTLSQSIASN